MKLAWRIWWWLVFIAGSLYFLLPLVGTLAFSLRPKDGKAYADLAANEGFLASMGYSFLIGLITIVVSVVLVVPTAFWVRLRLPKARPIVEFLTLLPFVVPPVVFVFGLLSSYARPPLALADSDMGLNVLLVAAYVILSMPYMYRAVDAGLGSIDVHSLTEAAQSLGAGWPTILLRVILPNIRVAVLGGAFLTLAIVVGEFTIATFLARPAFAPFLVLLGSSAPFQQSAAALLSFGITWLAMIVIAWLGRGAQTRVTFAGAR